MDKILAIVLDAKFLALLLGLAATVFGLLGMPGLQAWISDPATLDTISNLLAAVGIGGATAAGAAAVAADKPPELKK